MIRSLLMTLAVLAFTSPAFAGDNSGSTLVKGGKSYQTRQIGSETDDVQKIEPAAGAEMSSEAVPSGTVAPASEESSDAISGKKMMKLHGKK